MINVYYYVAITRNENAWYCSFRRRPNDERTKSLMDKHRCPANVPNMAVPRTNTEVWEILPRGQQVTDNATQRVQAMQVHALSALLSIINQIGSGNGGMTETHLSTLTDAT